MDAAYYAGRSAREIGFRLGLSSPVHHSCLCVGSLSGCVLEGLSCSSQPVEFSKKFSLHVFIKGIIDAAFELGQEFREKSLCPHESKACS